MNNAQMRRNSTVDFPDLGLFPETGERPQSDHSGYAGMHGVYNKQPNKTSQIILSLYIHNRIYSETFFHFENKINDVLNFVRSLICFQA